MARLSLKKFSNYKIVKVPLGYIKETEKEIKNVILMFIRFRIPGF